MYLCPFHNQLKWSHQKLSIYLGNSWKKKTLLWRRPPIFRTKNTTPLCPKRPWLVLEWLDNLWTLTWWGLRISIWISRTEDRVFSPNPVRAIFSSLISKQTSARCKPQVKIPQNSRDNLKCLCLWSRRKRSLKNVKNKWLIKITNMSKI